MDDPKNIQCDGRIVALFRPFHFHVNGAIVLKWMPIAHWFEMYGNLHCELQCNSQRSHVFPFHNVRCGLMWATDAEDNLSWRNAHQYSDMDTFIFHWYIITFHKKFKKKKGTNNSIVGGKWIKSNMKNVVHAMESKSLWMLMYSAMCVYRWRMCESRASTHSLAPWAHCAHDLHTYLKTIKLESLIWFWKSGIQQKCKTHVHHLHRQWRMFQELWFWEVYITSIYVFSPCHVKMEQNMKPLVTKSVIFELP